MARQIYVRDERQRITKAWWLIWGLAAILYILFIIEPSWFVIPPFIHNFKVTGG